MWRVCWYQSYSIAELKVMLCRWNWPYLYSLTFRTCAILSIALSLRRRRWRLSRSVRAEGMFTRFPLCSADVCVSTHVSYDDWNKIKQLLRCCIYSLFTLATPPSLLHSFSFVKGKTYSLTKIYLPKSLSYGKELHPLIHVCKFLF